MDGDGTVKKRWHGDVHFTCRRVPWIFSWSSGLGLLTLTGGRPLGLTKTACVLAPAAACSWERQMLMVVASGCVVPDVCFWSKTETLLWNFAMPSFCWKRVKTACVKLSLLGLLYAACIQYITNTKLKFILINWFCSWSVYKPNLMRLQSIPLIWYCDYLFL